MAWQDEFKEALIRYVITSGTLVAEGPGSAYGGWQDFAAYPSLGWEHQCSAAGSGNGTMQCAPSETQCPYCHAPRPDPADQPPAHIKACGINFRQSSYQDSDWSEFAGTFAEPPWEQRHGTDVIAYCSPRAWDGPRPRCDAYQHAAELIGRYRRAYQRMTGPPEPEQGHPIHLHELIARIGEE